MQPPPAINPIALTYRARQPQGMRTSRVAVASLLIAMGSPLLALLLFGLLPAPRNEHLGSLCVLFWIGSIAITPLLSTASLVHIHFSRRRLQGQEWAWLAMGISLMSWGFIGLTYFVLRGLFGL